MSEENQISMMYKLAPKNYDTPEFQALLDEFDARDVKLKGIITIPKNNQLVTDEGHLLMIFPDRLDFATAAEPDEFVLLAEK